jgi:hypothetical protein
MVDAAHGSYLTLGDELSDSERKNIWDDDGQLLSWTRKLLRLRDAEVAEQWQAELQRQKAATPKYAAAIAQATQILVPARLPYGIEWLPENKIVFVRPRGNPRKSKFTQPFADAKFIAQHWQRVFGRQRRKGTMTAYDAAAKHHGVETTQLRNYGRHRSRPSRRAR